MKFYSDVTNKTYETVDELKEAEVAAEAARVQEEERLQKRATREKELEDAYRVILEDKKKYTELLEKFIEDYGSYRAKYFYKFPLTNEDIDNWVHILFG